MSDWYDRTAGILRRMNDQQTPVRIWADVVTNRLTQARAYMMYVARRRAALIPSMYPLDTWARETESWRKMLKVPPGDWYEVRSRIIEQARQAFADMPSGIYLSVDRRLVLNDLCGYWFDDLHTLGHTVGRNSQGRLSDSPYSPRPKPQGIVIPDSDLWLKTNHPELIKGL